MLSSYARHVGRWAGVLMLSLAAACRDDATMSSPLDPSGDQDLPPVIETVASVKWNETARSLVMKYNTSAPATIRMFALLTVAQYNAVIGAEQSKDGPVHPSPRAAVAGASVAVLSYIYPQEIAYLEGLLDEQEASLAPPGSGHEDFGEGELVGRTVAATVVNRAQTDRFFDPFAGTVPVCAGCWLPVPTPPAFATLGNAKPFFLSSNDQFRPAPPPAFASPEFVAGLTEVRQIADTRTAEQDSIAKFWALGPGTVSAQGHFNKLASELIVKYHLSEREAAHRLALLNMAAYDVIVASHEAKYHFWLIRPSQADPLIVRAIGLPSFPSYPSNHSALAGSAAMVLGKLFPSERTRLDAMAAEAAISRLYGGIHYRFDTSAGLALGRQVAAWALAHDVVGHRPFPLQ